MHARSMAVHPCSCAEQCVASLPCLQERLEASDRRPCPSCGGSGLQPCFCTKWSDGDVGCSSCSSSGWTKCKSCGGGGLAVPIKVSIRK